MTSPKQESRPSRQTSEVDSWLARLSRDGRNLQSLLSRSHREQLGLGYGHTLREVAQQPITWEETARRARTWAARLTGVVAKGGLRDGSGVLVFTGSGSSHFVGQCLALPLQAAFGAPALALPAGLLLTHGEICILPGRSLLVVSFGRSGDSPESAAVIDRILRSRPLAQHLLITCNRKGRMATGYSRDSRVATVVLDQKTNDRSLVMTSSFTNMFLAGRFLGSLGDPLGFERRCRRLAAAARRILSKETDCLGVMAHSGFRTAVFLGTGPRFGSAREAALKMLEMTSGRVTTFAESYLGLRHGPLSAVKDDTLVVAFLAHDRRTRAFEVDVLRELRRKRLGSLKVVVGAEIPAGVLGRDDLAVGPPEMEKLDDADMPALDVLVGQLLAFFRCREEGLRPDNPSPSGVINRVVARFKLHGEDRA